MARWLSEMMVSQARQGTLASLPGLVVMALMVLSAVGVILGMCTLRHKSSESKMRSKDSEESDESLDRSGSLAGSEGCITPKSLSFKRLQWLTKSKESKRQELLHLQEQYRKQDDMYWENSGAVWQRAILLGEKCEPPAFSGLILYDEKGKRVPEYPAKSLRAGLLPTEVGSIIPEQN